MGTIWYASPLLSWLHVHTNVNEEHPDESLLSQSVRHCLDRPAMKGYRSQLMQGYSDMRALKQLARRHRLSAVDRIFYKTYIVAFHHSSAEFQRRQRILFPSFFLTTELSW